MTIPQEIMSLVERFDRNLSGYRSGRYKEARIRAEFIDPFFKALGWDVANEQGYAEAYKDVVIEDSIEVAGATKAPDYCFRIGGTRKFFVEAKKPSVNLKDDITPAYQLRRYAWSSKLPLSILTDFEEFTVYDCQSRPSKTDHASTARIEYMTFEEYPERFHEIEAIFSREAILQGSFDKYAISNKRRKGTAEVDNAFLQEIETWREMLARNIAIRNPNLSQQELNFAVQRTIDRIIFLRISEDRGIEPYGRLQELISGSGLYSKLCLLFRQADNRYNSGLFHFQIEPDRAAPPDTITLELSIDDNPLRQIISNLYYPDSPYEFSVLPADILGQVYEQFLGKVIRLTPSHRAVIEEKPEVRKAGGVYYTPSYIVDYMIRNTVGEMIKGKKAAPRGPVSKIKILDPACGSGSFLVSAYQLLLDWHQDQYSSQDPEKHARGRPARLYQTKNGEWKLTIDEKKRILLDNIFGTDLDPQAVEVTKLSLLLKVLEGETKASLGQLELLAARVLPDLGKNIKCGNSLISSDFYEDQQYNFLESEDVIRINPFDWESEAGFREIMSLGGFNVVIGNPPYIDSVWMTKELPECREYCNGRYHAARGNWDIFCVFIEKAMNLCKDNGLASFIVPNKLGSAGYAAGARAILTEQNQLVSLRDYSSVPVFPVSVYPIVYIAKKKSPRNNSKVVLEKMVLTDDYTIEVQSSHELIYDQYFQTPSQPWAIFHDIQQSSPI